MSRLSAPGWKVLCLFCLLATCLTCCPVNYLRIRVEFCQMAFTQVSWQSQGEKKMGHLDHENRIWLSVLAKIIPYAYRNLERSSVKARKKGNSRIRSFCSFFPSCHSAFVSLSFLGPIWGSRWSPQNFWLTCSSACPFSWRRTAFWVRHCGQ